jgi:PEP-CTERM motif-containing protein
VAAKEAFATAGAMQAVPSFANAGLYGVLVSDGVANVPVPEPAAMLLSLVGTGSIVAAYRRTRSSFAP